MCGWHPIFDVDIKRVSMGDGLAFHALWRTVCIILCSVIGYYLVNDLWMRFGVQSSSTSRSSGSVGMPSGDPLSGAPGTVTWPDGFGKQGIGFGKGAL